MLQPQSVHFSPRQKSSFSWRIDDNISLLTSLVCRTQQICPSSPYQRPRRYKRRTRRFYTASNQWLVWTVLVVSVLAFGAQASDREYGRKRFGSFVRSGQPVWHIDTTPSLGDVPEEIFFDRSPAPGSEARLHRRQGGDLFGSVKPSPKAAATAASTSANPRLLFSDAATAVPSSDSSDGSAVTPAAHSRTSSPTSTSSSDSSSSTPSETGIVMAPGTSSSGLPKVFEGGLGNNYTERSCPSFLQSMINNQTFTDCLPFSLLLQVNLSPYFTRVQPALKLNLI